MSNESYRIQKREEPVTLWVHPDGPVKGKLYLQEQSDRGERPEHPVEIMNTDVPFIVVHCEDPDETRFYGKRAVVRVHHEPMEGEPETSDITVVPCELRLMDGSLLSGTIREFLLPEHRRLFDYLNQRGEPFLRLHLDDGGICLVNKAYIVRAAELEDVASES
ncbi:MAG: hypothetical protein U5K43_01695 [Halofilum sp. (in: g-proteobacteria)]|nr:hypothetical protein [Halofilum sp. (in: g-proteobacteria)]